MVYCRNCGEELPEDAYFCHKCGQITLKGEGEGASPREFPPDWESKIESAVSKAVRNVEEGLMTAIEDSRYGYGAYPYEAEERKHFSGEAPHDKIYFEVDTFNGHIEVSTWEKDEYSVELEIVARGRTKEDAEKNLKELKVDLEKRIDDDQLNLILSIERPVEWRRHYSVDVYAILPERACIDPHLTSKNGHISISKLHGETVRFRTSNGRIELEEVSAKSITGKSSNGHIVLDGVMGDKVSVKSSNGRIRGRLEAKAAMLTTSNGSIRMDLPCKESGAYKLRTSNGKIDVKVPENPEIGYYMDLSTSMGKIDIELPDLEYHRRRRNHREARTTGFEEKEVQIEIEADTSMGKININ
jgi:DUF4097 and DUF4098 domain-containing protein YvlB